MGTTYTPLWALWTRYDYQERVGGEEKRIKNCFLYNKNAFLQFREHIYPQIDKYRQIVKDNLEQEPDNFVWAYMAELEKRRRTGEDMGYFR